jgi:hypothetical protein
MFCIIVIAKIKFVYYYNNFEFDVNLTDEMKSYFFITGNYK